MTLLLLTSCSTEVIHDLDEGEANEILAALDSQGIRGDKLRTTQGNTPSYTIVVDRSDVVSAWQALQRLNLPRTKHQGLGEIFGKTGLIPTAFQQQALMHHAVAGELSKTLESVNGVLEARVHVVMPERDPLAASDSPGPAPKASVLVRASSKSPLTERDIRQLVAGAVKDLPPERVSVLRIVGQDDVSATGNKATSAVMARLGPFSVAKGSRSSLLVTLISGLLIVVLLGLGMLLMLRRNRALALHARRTTAATQPNQALESSLSIVERSFSRGRREPTAEGRGKT